MIGYLNGTTLFELEGNIIIDVNGVGYTVACTEQTQSIALQKQEIQLFIHTIVRETALDLYGFETKQELYFFKKLLDVSGIGPRSALAMISLASPDTLYQAILSSNIDFLTSVPGIGKKTAERMCIELRDKLKDYSGNTEQSTMNEKDKDIVDALVALGYTNSQAYKALSEIPNGEYDMNEKIKLALGVLST